MPTTSESYRQRGSLDSEQQLQPGTRVVEQDAPFEVADHHAPDCASSEANGCARARDDAGAGHLRVALGPRPPGAAPARRCRRRPGRRARGPRAASGCGAGLASIACTFRPVAPAAAWCAHRARRARKISPPQQPAQQQQGQRGASSAMTVACVGAGQRGDHHGQQQQAPDRQAGHTGHHGPAQLAGAGGRSAPRAMFSRRAAGARNCMARMRMARQREIGKQLAPDGGARDGGPGAVSHRTRHAQESPAPPRRRPPG